MQLESVPENPSKITIRNKKLELKVKNSKNQFNNLASNNQPTHNEHLMSYVRIEEIFLNILFLINLLEGKCLEI